MEISLHSMRYVHHTNSFYKQFHTHDLCELAYYVNGQGSLSQNGHTYEYGKGTVHLVHGGISHDESNNAESKIILIYFEMPKDFVPSGVYIDSDGAILSLLRRLRVEMQENLMYKQDMLDCVLKQILLSLKRKLLPGPTENKNFNHIVRYIDENFQFEIDVHKLSEQAFYSYDRFRHVFKEHTGFAPLEYINNKRIDLAKFLIDIDPMISLTALSSECGFSSLSKFSNCFKAKTGMSPSQYRNLAKEDSNMK